MTEAYWYFYLVDPRLLSSGCCFMGIDIRYKDMYSLGSFPCIQSISISKLLVFHTQPPFWPLEGLPTSIQVIPSYSPLSKYPYILFLLYAVGLDTVTQWISPVYALNSDLWGYQHRVQMQFWSHNHIIVHSLICASVMVQWHCSAAFWVMKSAVEGMGLFQNTIGLSLISPISILHSMFLYTKEIYKLLNLPG